MVGNAYLATACHIGWNRLFGRHSFSHASALVSLGGMATAQIAGWRICSSSCWLHRSGRGLGRAGVGAELASLGVPLGAAGPESMGTSGRPASCCLDRRLWRFLSLGNL